MAKRSVWLVKKGTPLYYVNGFKIHKSKATDGLTHTDAEQYKKGIFIGPDSDYEKQFWGNLDKDVFLTLAEANDALRAKLDKAIVSVEKKLTTLRDVESKPAELVDDYAKK